MDVKQFVKGHIKIKLHRLDQNRWVSGWRTGKHNGEIVGYSFG
jgi:hypothetical protein